MITPQEVAAARAARGWSRRRLAEAAGLTETKIWRIETKGVMSADEAARLADALRPASTGGDTLAVTAATIASALVDGLAGLPDVLFKSRDSAQDRDTALPVANPQVDTAVGPDRVLDGDVDAVAAAFSVPTHVVMLGDELAEGEVQLLDVGPPVARRLVSNSEVQAFKRCRRRWWLAWYRGLRLRRVSPVGPRAVGDRVHRALARWYVPPGTPRLDPRDALEELITTDRAALPVETDPDTLARFESEADLERVMLAGYTEWLAETGADSELVVTAPETYLEARLADDTTADGKPVFVIGRLDVRVRRTSDDARLLLDHKTRADVRPVLLPLDEQMLHYVLLETLQPTGDGSHCDGALYNVLRRVRRTAAARPPFYRRIEVRHNPHTLTSFETRLRGTVADLLDAEADLLDGVDHRVVAYPTAASDCAWTCDFLPVCGMLDDGSRAESFLETAYEVGDPLDYYTEGR